MTVMLDFETIRFSFGRILLLLLALRVNSFISWWRQLISVRQQCAVWKTYNCKEHKCSTYPIRNILFLVCAFTGSLEFLHIMVLANTWMVFVFLQVFPPDILLPTTTLTSNSESVLEDFSMVFAPCSTGIGCSVYFPLQTHEVCKGT